MKFSKNASLFAHLNKNLNRSLATLARIMSFIPLV